MSHKQIHIRTAMAAKAAWNLGLLSLMFFLVVRENLETILVRDNSLEKRKSWVNGHVRSKAEKNMNIGQ